MSEFEHGSSYFIQAFQQKCSDSSNISNIYIHFFKCLNLPEYAKNVTFCTVLIILVCNFPIELKA